VEFAVLVEVFFNHSHHKEEKLSDDFFRLELSPKSIAEVLRGLCCVPFKACKIRQNFLKSYRKVKRLNILGWWSELVVVTAMVGVYKCLQRTRTFEL
jgi:hypothetical protein